MSEKMKKILWWVFAIVLVVVCVVWMLNSNLEHIEDLNGEDNYSLATITDQQIIDCDMGYLNLKKSNGILSGDSIEFSSNKFTGVCQVFSEDVILSTDFVIELTNFVIEAGNFEMVVLLDDEIVARIEPDEESVFTDYHMGNVSGVVSLVIAGESADFSFSIDASEYDITE